LKKQRKNVSSIDRFIFLVSITVVLFSGASVATFDMSKVFLLSSTIFRSQSITYPSILKGNGAYKKLARIVWLFQFPNFKLLKYIIIISDIKFLVNLQPKGYKRKYVPESLFFNYWFHSTSTDKLCILNIIFAGKNNSN
jgi:hypothetical protein